jgi:hypothetical protein
MYATSLDLNMGYYHMLLTPFPAGYVLLYYHGENMSIADFLWVLVLAQMYSGENK